MGSGLIHNHMGAGWLSHGSSQTGTHSSIRWRHISYTVPLPTHHP